MRQKKKCYWFNVTGDQQEPEVFQMISTWLFFIQISFTQILLLATSNNNNYLWKITSIRMCTSFWIQFSNLDVKLVITWVITSPWLQSHLISFFIFSNVWGKWKCTRDFRYPHKKNSLKYSNQILGAIGVPKTWNYPSWRHMHWMRTCYAQPSTTS